MELRLSPASGKEMDLNNLAPVIAIVGGVAMLIHAGMIWSRGSARVADPFLLGPITGGVGYIVVRLIVGKLEVEGWGAKSVALLSVVYGLMLGLGGIWSLDLPQVREILATITTESASPKSPPPVEKPAPIAPPSNPERPNAPQPSPQAVAAVDTKAPEPKPKAPVMQPMPKNWRPEGLRPVGID